MAERSLRISSIMSSEASLKSKAKDVSSALTSVFDADAAEESAEVNVKAPDIAENGAVVPVTISSTMAGVTAMALVIEQNGTPLAATYNLSGAKANVSTRVKMGKTSNVIAVVEANGKLYKAAKEVKVTIGGCGG